MKTAAETRCIHHWLIAGNNWGVCKKCGEKKKFPTIGDLSYKWTSTLEDEMVLIHQAT